MSPRLDLLLHRAARRGPAASPREHPPGLMVLTLPANVLVDLPVDLLVDLLVVMLLDLLVATLVDLVVSLLVVPQGSPPPLLNHHRQHRLLPPRHILGLPPLPPNPSTTSYRPIRTPTNPSQLLTPAHPLLRLRHLLRHAAAPSAPSAPAPTLYPASRSRLTFRTRRDRRVSGTTRRVEDGGGQAAGPARTACGQSRRSASTRSGEDLGAFWRSFGGLSGVFF